VPPALAPRASRPGEARDRALDPSKLSPIHCRSTESIAALSDAGLTEFGTTGAISERR